MTVTLQTKQLKVSSERVLSVPVVSSCSTLLNSQFHKHRFMVVSLYSYILQPSVWHLHKWLQLKLRKPKTGNMDAHINQATGICNPAYSCACPKPG